MAEDVFNWMRQRTLGIGGYVGLSGVLTQIQIPPIKLGAVVNTLGTINIVIACLVGVVTLTLKGIDLYRKIKRKEDKDDPS